MLKYPWGWLVWADTLMHIWKVTEEGALLDISALLNCIYNVIVDYFLCDLRKGLLSPKQVPPHSTLAANLTHLLFFIEDEMFYAKSIRAAMHRRRTSVVPAAYDLPIPSS
eukprot:RCo043107